MTNYNIADEDILLDFAPVTEAEITLTEEQIAQAVQISQSIINPQQQWQTYLNALALFGFTDWLGERDSNLNVNSNNCSLAQAHYASYIDGVFNLEVGEFRVCLLTDGVAMDELITFPRAILELPQYTAHLYVLVNVIEERAEIAIDSFITYTDLQVRIQESNLAADADWTYEVPLTWFNSSSDDLLLYLRCLDSQSITLPQASSENDSDSAQELIDKANLLQDPKTELSSVLTWKQGQQLLGNPELLNWLYQLQSGNLSLSVAIANLQDRLTSTVREVSQAVINARSWLNRELDDLAQNLAWNVLPAPAFATSAFRDIQVTNRESPVAEFEAVLAQLRASGEEIPVDAGGVYRDLTIGNYALRLFAITWEEAEPEDVPEWNLLVVLGARVGSYLPANLKLEIKLETEVLDEQIVETDTEDTYLYSRVIGEMSEQFTVNITLATGETISLPKFAFQ